MKIFSKERYEVTCSLLVVIPSVLHFVELLKNTYIRPKTILGAFAGTVSKPELMNEKAASIERFCVLNLG